MSTVKQSDLMATDEFSDLKLFLKSLFYICNDVHIVDGKVLQRSNDQTTVIGCDLSGIFRIQGSWIFSDIKEVYGNLDNFDKYSPVIIKLYEGMLEIDDGSMSTTFQSANEQYCDNKKMSAEEVDKIFATKSSLLKAKLPKELCCKVIKACDLHNINCVKIRIIANEASLHVSTQAEDRRTSFKMQHSLLTKIHDLELNITTVPFSFKKDAVVSVGLSDDNAIALLKFEVAISKRIILEIYARGSLHKIEN
jgi:hypothetical protein